MKRYLFFVILGVIDPKNLSNRHGFSKKISTKKLKLSLFVISRCILRKCMLEIVFRGYISDLGGGQQQTNYLIYAIEHQK